MESIQIQRLQKEDYHTNYFSLLRQLSSLNDERVTFEDFSQFVDSLHEHHQIWVIKDIQRNYIIGTGTLLIEQKIIRDMGKVGHIEDIIIDHHSRGHQYGLMIVNHLKNIALKRGCYKTILDCQEYLEYFYKKNGFSKKGIQMSIYH